MEIEKLLPFYPFIFFSPLIAVCTSYLCSFLKTFYVFVYIFCLSINYYYFIINLLNVKNSVNFINKNMFIVDAKVKELVYSCNTVIFLHSSRECMREFFPGHLHNH